MFRSDQIVNDGQQGVSKAILGPDGPIASIPTLSYSFHHSDANNSDVMWLSREENIVSVCTDVN